MSKYKFAPRQQLSLRGVEKNDFPIAKLSETSVATRAAITSAGRCLHSFGLATPTDTSEIVGQSNGGARNSALGLFPTPEFSLHAFA